MSVVADEEREDLITQILDNDPETKMPKRVSTPDRKAIRDKRNVKAGELRRLDKSALRMLLDEIVN